MLGQKSLSQGLVIQRKLLTSAHRGFTLIIVHQSEVRKKPRTLVLVSSNSVLGQAKEKMVV